jgi:predicted N-acyltransferase
MGGAQHVAYRCTIVDSLDSLDAQAWDTVCAVAGASLFLDRRFLAAVCVGMKDESQCRFVIVSDAAGNPVACTALSTVTMIVADFVNPRLPWILRLAPRIIPPLKALICGLPGSPGEKNLAILPNCDRRQVLDALDESLNKLARGLGMLGIIYREFGPADLTLMDGLMERGYSRSELPQMYMLNRSFPDFDAYCAALRRNYRREIARSRQKMKEAGIRPVTLSKTADMLKAYTPEVHAMYCDMVGRAAFKQAPLPIGYFQELATRLEGTIELVTLMRDNRILATGWCARDGSAQHFLFAGVDYRLNRELELYFNLVFACLDRSFQLGVERIHIGQASSFFKARIGSEPEGRYVYARGLGPIMSRLARFLSGRLIANDDLSVAPSRAFKSNDGSSHDGTDAKAERELVS